MAAPPRLSGKRAALIAVVVVIVVAFGVRFVSQALFASWSIGLFGHNTLTGDWIGPMRAKQGAVFGVFLHLDYKPREGSTRRTRRSGSRTSNLLGQATICTPTGQRYDYAVSGFASPFGVVEALYFEFADPKLSALNLRLAGEWRPPTLQLQPDANPFLPDGRFVANRVLRGDDPDDSIAAFDLSRGTIDELDLCRRAR